MLHQFYELLYSTMVEICQKIHAEILTWLNSFQRIRVSLQINKYIYRGLWIVHLEPFSEVDIAQ